MLFLPAAHIHTNNVSTLNNASPHGGGIHAHNDETSKQVSPECITFCSAVRVSTQMYVCFSPHLDRIYTSDIDRIRIPGVNRVEEWNALWEATGLYSVLMFFSSLFNDSSFLCYFSVFLPSWLKNHFRDQHNGLDQHIFPNWWRTLSVVVNGLEYFVLAFSLYLSSLVLPHPIITSFLFNIQHIQSSDVFALILFSQKNTYCLIFLCFSLLSFQYLKILLLILRTHTYLFPFLSCSHGSHATVF